MMTTFSRASDFEALRSSARELISEAAQACIDFITVELKLAQTLLDAAAAARDETARERRIARAEEALRTVQRFIDAPPPLVRIPDEEHARFAAELRRVQERLTSMR